MITQRPIAELLVKSGLLGPADLARALEIQARDGGSLGRILANLGIAEEEAVSRAIAGGLGLEYTPLDPKAIPRDVGASLPAAFCRQRLVVPLEAQGRSLRLAMADPLDHSTIQDVEFRSSKWVSVLVATETAILAALRHLHPEIEDESLPYDLLPIVQPEGQVEASVEDDYEVVDPAQLAHDVKLPPIVRLVNLMLTEAAKAGASDIHFEPQETCVQVRHRVDGILHDVMKIPKRLQQAVISRLKIISGMDIAERRKPQDGRSRLRIDQRRIDLRVSTLPTHHGEKVLIRLLDSADAEIDIARIGMSADVLRALQDLLTRPQGMILVTGPTGSGKSSTLYASLNWVKSRAKNVITVEDPIELQLAGISQVQINTRAGVTFAAGLRSILRQDPDIVMVGEIRDQETAGIALDAAQTGHLLLSTLHTNDAPSSITRLLELGVERFMVASSIIGILAQRLVRRVCSECAVERPPAAEVLARIGGPARVPAGACWRAGRGCAACHDSGYRGRLGVHELLVVSDTIRESIHRRVADHMIREAARAAGMRTLMEDAVTKAAQGFTTLEEVLRAAPLDEPHPERSAPALRPAGEPVAISGSRQAGPAAMRPGAAAKAAGRPAAATKPRVIVVEDSPTVVAVVKYFLELEGFEVLTAEDGLAGLELARRSRPQVVVSDLNMPGLDGISLTKALREDPETRAVGIIMLTSETSVESEAQGLAIGADGYLTKPVEPRRLAAHVKAVLARTRGRLADTA